MVRQLATSLLILVLALPSAWAGEPVFSPKRFQHVAERQTLRELLSTFAVSQGWQVQIQGSLDDLVSARFSMSPPEFWRLVTSAHQLQWYFDGSTMFVSPTADQRTEFLPMAPSRYERFTESLRRLDILDARCSPRFDPEARLAVLTGPPRCVELASAVASQIGDGRDSDFVTRIFALRSSQAADVRVRHGSQETVIEGMASTLRRIFGLDGTASEAPPERRDDRRPLAANTASRLALGRDRTDAPPVVGEVSLTGRPISTARPQAAPPDSTHSSLPLATGPTRARIEADAATNSVIVRDLAYRMEQYSSLIAELDRARSLVEIEARMIEVERGELDDLGVDWSLSGRRGSISASNGVGVVAGDARAPQITASLAGNAALQFMTRVRALESRGRARIVMSPRLLAVENSEALLENTETAYVKVSGNLEANLFSVSTGVVMRIRPSLLGSRTKPRVHLVITLEEGAFSSAAVGDVPVVQRSRVFSLSELEEGETLLIGGLSDQRARSEENGVPGLARLPLVGGLFRSKTDAQSTREKLFLVTPRIVRPNASSAAMPEHAPTGPGFQQPASPATDPTTTTRP